MYGVVNQKGLCFARKATRCRHELQLLMKTGILSRKEKRRDISLMSAILHDGLMEHGHFCKQFTKQSAKSKGPKTDVIAFVL